MADPNWSSSTSARWSRRRGRTKQDRAGVDRLPFTETFEFDPTERKFSVELASGTTAYAVYLRPTLDAHSSTRRPGVWLLSRLGLSRCSKLEDRKFAESVWKHTYAETA